MRIIGILRSSNEPAVGYLRSDRYLRSYDVFLRNYNGPQGDVYLRSWQWAFDVAAEAPPAGDVTGTAAGSITALTGATVGAHGVKGDASGSITALTGATVGAHGVKGDASGSITALTGATVGAHGVKGTSSGSIAEITGAAAGEHSEPAPPATVSNQGGYGGEIRARRRVEEPEEVRRAKSRRAVMARLYHVKGAARGQLPVVFGLANARAGVSGMGFGAVGKIGGHATGGFSQFSASEIEEIMSMIEAIEALESLPEAA